MNSDTFVANRIDKAAQRQWMIGKMARLAIHGEREIEARSLFGFQNAGAFKETETNDSFPYAKLAGIVGNPKHHLKVPSPPGPCVLIRPENTSNAHEVFRVANLLIVKPIKCRRTALTYFDNLANAGLLTERSKQTILACRSDLLSSETNRWRQAASRIYDATEQDWLLNLAGLRQALEWNFEVGIWDYLPNVLRPSIIAVDSIDLVWWHPHDQRGEIKQAIEEIVRTEQTFTGALDRYLHSLGHVPLAADLSMGRLVAEWHLHNPNSGFLWHELWSWANSKNSPLARYHACQSAASDPTLIPEGCLADFWTVVEELLSSETDDGGKWSNVWQLRFHLARHYCHYFECFLPWNDGERAAALAWWLTERVASLLDEINVSLEYLQDMFFARTHLHWYLARTRAGVSEMRIQTLFCPSIWQRSLIAQLGSSATLGLGDATTNQREIIETCMGVHAWQDFRFETPAGDVTSPGYAFELPLEKSIREWLATVPDDDKKHELEAFLDAFPGIRNAPLLDQLSAANSFTLFGLKTSAYFQSSQIEQLEKLLRDDTVATKLLTSMDEISLWLFADVLMESAAATETEWRVVVPHALAIACLASEDEERRNLLFVLVTHCSVATDTISAIRMILDHPEGYRFRSVAFNNHKFLNAQLSTTPPRLAARIRPVLVALNA